jgi:hypothetical protein
VIDVTASSHTLTYGDPKPNVTCAYDNADFKGTDDGNDIDTPPTGSTTYNQGDDVGTYPTSCAGGADNNYTFNYTPGAGGVGGNAGPGAITVGKKSVSGTFVAADKVYDGNTSATASNRALVGVLAGDTVTLQGGTAAFPSKNVGNDYNVPLTGATLGGADAGNYTLTGVADDKANITPAPIKGAFTAADKPYDGNTNATITGRSVTSGIVGSENVTIEGGTANFLDPEPGENKPVKGNGNFTLGGADKSNYVLVEVADTTATIQRPPAPAPPVIDTTPQCLRRPVLAFVRGKRIKQVVFYLDGKKIGIAKKRDAKRRYATLIERKLLADGPHKLRAKVTFLGTKKVYWLGIRLKRCVGQAAPSEILTTAPANGSCPASEFLAYVKGGTISSVRYTLNGERLRTVRVADWKKRYAVKIDPSQLGSGPNVLEAHIRFITGSKKAAVTLTEELPSCRSTFDKKR